MPENGEATLFVVYLGGDPQPGRVTEDHEVVTVVAHDVAEACPAGRRKWSGVGRPHVDAVKAIRVVDGHLVRLERTTLTDADVVDLTYEPDDA
jgi:uncharacterized protein DUF1543